MGRAVRQSAHDHPGAHQRLTAGTGSHFPSATHGRVLTCPAVGSAVCLNPMGIHGIRLPRPHGIRLAPWLRLRLHGSIRLRLGWRIRLGRDRPGTRSRARAARDARCARMVRARTRMRRVAPIRQVTDSKMCKIFFVNTATRSIAKNCVKQKRQNKPIFIFGFLCFFCFFCLCESLCTHYR